MDTVCDHLAKLKMDKKLILVKRYLNEEEYDTEAMDLDLKINDDTDTESVGNISQHTIKKKKCMNAVIVC